ncbi:hypothetical protein [Sandaracinobacteroides saxicola]|uniref:Uncharacterized protein n=1 Tax=Sandaracinobacteroides saxicola TaxID=2759707 RepID=A0A7G5IGG4_9SPHN|nr:hypothetical protein [Sandaracinobacteroides saxicola]QMW22456.1 hypothetical protein H3309_14100 [Sandaracinobacteroides saxicola]
MIRFLTIKTHKLFCFLTTTLNQYTAAGPAVFLYDAHSNLRSDGSTTMVKTQENRLESASGTHTAALARSRL